MNWKTVKCPLPLFWWSACTSYDFTAAVQYSVRLLNAPNPAYFITALILIAIFSYSSLYFYGRLKRSERLFELEEKYGIS